MQKHFFHLVSFTLALSLIADFFFAIFMSPTHAPLKNCFQGEALGAQLRYVNRLITTKDPPLFHGTQVPGQLREPVGLTSKNETHVGFGIHMAADAYASKETLVARKKTIMDALKRGELPLEFHRETIRMNGSSWEVVVHQEVMKRIESQGISLNEFIQNTVKIRGPRYTQLLMEKLNRKRLVIDALNATPALYGNCLTDGYTYVNVHAPVTMDLVGISHEWMHEAGLFSGSKKDEARLAIEDRTIMEELGLDQMFLLEALGSHVKQTSPLLTLRQVDETLFIGAPEELNDILQPFLVKMGWAPDKIDRFFRNLRKFLITPQRPGNMMLPGLRSQAWQVLLSVGRRGDLEDYEAINRLDRRLEQFKLLTMSDSGLVKKQLLLAYLGIAALDHGQKFSSFLALRCLEFDKRPLPPLLQTLLPHQLARTLLSFDVAAFANMLGNDSLVSSEILNAFPAELRQQTAKKALALMNSNELSIKEEPDYQFEEFYFAVINSFEDRVGLLKNAAAFRRYYKSLFDDMLEISGEMEMEGSSDRDFISGYLREQLDREPEQSEIDQGIAEDQNRSLGSLEAKMLEFFNYNPGPEMLEQVIDFFRQDPSKHPLRLSPAEANTLIWLVRHIPKRDGFTRDRRRQVHRFILAMWEDGYRDPAAATRKFMGEVISSIEIPRMSPQGVTEALNFMLQFTNLSPPLRQTVARELSRHLEAWRQTASNGKSFLGPDQFKEMTELINKVLIEHLVAHAVSFTPKEIKQLRKNVAKHPAAWDREDFLRLLASYHSFQNIEGKQHTENFIRELLASKIKNERFTALPRYKWPPDIRKWIGPTLLRAWRAGVRKKLSTENWVLPGAAQFQGIFLDTLEHLGIRPPSRPEELNQHIRDWIHAPENQDIPEGERQTLASTMSDILSALAVGAPISTDQVREWKQRLLPQGPRPYWYESREAWREIFVNLEQISRVQTFDWSQVTGLTFEVTDDPVDFALSGAQPYQTCQRLNEPTGQNNNGTPINRLRQGQFLLARLIAHKKDGASTILARAHLELAEGIRPEDFSLLEKDRTTRKTNEQRFLESIFGVFTEETVDKKTVVQPSKVLLVERIYQQGPLRTDLFYREILKWALQNPRTRPLFDYAIFAGREVDHGEQIYLRFLPSDGPIYRDTFREGVSSALNLKALGRGEESVEMVSQNLNQKGNAVITYSPHSLGSITTAAPAVAGPSISGSTAHHFPHRKDLNQAA